MLLTAGDQELVVKLHTAIFGTLLLLGCGAGVEGDDDWASFTGFDAGTGTPPTTPIDTGRPYYGGDGLLGNGNGFFTQFNSNDPCPSNAACDTASPTTDTTPDEAIGVSAPYDPETPVPDSYREHVEVLERESEYVVHDVKIDWER